MSTKATNKGDLSDAKLLSIAKERVRDGLTGSDSVLKSKRIRTLKYYNGEEPARLSPGSSSFVSRDVFDTVEARKASMLEAFSGNTRPVRFTPQSPEDVQAAEQATAYTDYVIFRQNNGYALFHDVIHNGLLTRAGIVQVSWKEDIREVDYDLTGQPRDVALMFILQNKDKLVSWSFEPSADDPNGLGDATITLRQDFSQVVIDLVPSEEFGVSSQSTDLNSAPAVWRKQARYLSDLYRAGYDKNVLKNLTADDGEPFEDWERSERFWDIGQSVGEENLERAKRVTVYDCYVRVDSADPASSQTDIYHVVYAQDQILKREKVSRHPFIAFVPMRVPSRFWGADFAATVIPIQIAQTMLTRSIIDHASITTNPRFTVLRGGLVNPVELTDPRLGGVVNITRPNAVQPLVNPPLNGMVFQTMSKMEAMKESITGTSDLQQGLSKDVLSSQNSSDLVQAMATLGQQRAKIMARNFANFLSELYLSCYQLITENEKQAKIIEVSGGFIYCNPVAWAERTMVTVDFALGYNELEKEASDLVQYDQYMSSDQSMQPYYTAQERYNLWSDVFTLKRKNITRYLKDPSTVQLPQGPSPSQQFQMDLAQREVAVKEMNAQAAMSKAQTAQQVAVSKGQSTAVGNIIKQEQMRLKAAQAEHKANIETGQLAIAAQAVHQKGAEKKVVLNEQ